MKRIIVIVILIIIVAGGLYAWKEYNRENPDLKETKTDFTSDAKALIAEFEKDKSAADQKYIGKTIEVTGTIKNIAIETNPAVFALGDDEVMSTVQCSMDSAYAHDYSALKDGHTVTMRGICTGSQSDELLGTDIKLNRCVLLNNN